MQCPYCDYVDGNFDDDWNIIRGDKGRFFSLSGNSMMCRPDYCSFDTECKELHACPNCGKTFIEV